ncbi:unnamed protein product, partial [Rotaria sordida]
SSDEDNDDIYYGDSNAIINKPVIKGDTAVGTSSRGGRMIFMNQYGVVDEFISIKTIVEEEYRKANLSAEEKRIMPLPVQIESGLNKLRRKALPPLPNDQKFIIPDVYKQTYTNERFLIYDKRKTAYGGRLLIFASEEQLKVLLQRHETYEAIFRCLNRLGSDMRIDLKPTTIICDFEQAFINAASNKLPQTFVTGCWFHFCLSCYRNIQKLGLMKVYDDDLKLRELLRGFMALALLPINRIQDGSAILKQNVLASNQTRQLEPFVSYFENEWLNTFKPSTWSVNTNTWRTNNFAEAQNKRFFSRVVQPHPNLWCFIQCLKQEESVISHRMVQTGLGFSSIKSNKSTRKAAFIEEMPVTTRAAALRSQANEAGTLPANETISKEGACFIVEQESPVSPVEFAIQVDSNRGHTGKKLSEEVDMSLEGLFSDQELILSAIHEDETAKQEVNKKSISPNSHNHQATSSSSTYSSTTSSVTKSSTATNEVIQKDHSIFSLASSDEDNDDIYYGDSNAIINKPVIKGDTAVGTSSRGGRMIFM